MNTRNIMILLIAGMVFLFGCGEPNEPESIFNSGGYKIVCTHPTHGAAQDVVVDGNYCYIAQGEGGLQIVNVSDKENPTDVSVITEDVRGYSDDIIKYHDFVYLAAGSYGYTSVDVTDPVNPFVVVSNMIMKPGVSAYLQDNFMFSAISEQGFQVAKLNDTGVPEILGKTLTEGYAQGVFVNSDRTLLFAACGETGLAIYDISDFQDGYGTYPRVAWINTYDYASSVAIDEANKIAMVASGEGGVVIIDYGDLSNLSILSTFHTDDDAFEVQYADGLAYITAEDGGFYVVNIDNPEEPVCKAHLRFTHALGFNVAEDHIYVADEADGLVIISKP